MLSAPAPLRYFFWNKYTKYRTTVKINKRRSVVNDLLLDKHEWRPHTALLRTTSRTWTRILSRKLGTAPSILRATYPGYFLFVYLLHSAIDWLRHEFRHHIAFTSLPKFNRFRWFRSRRDGFRTLQWFRWSRSAELGWFAPSARINWFWSARGFTRAHYLVMGPSPRRGPIIHLGSTPRGAGLGRRCPCVGVCGVPDWCHWGRRFPLPTLQAQLPRRVHRHMAQEQPHVPIVQGRRLPSRGAARRRRRMGRCLGILAAGPCNGSPSGPRTKGSSDRWTRAFSPALWLWFGRGGSLFARERAGTATFGRGSATIDHGRSRLNDRSCWMCKYTKIIPKKKFTHVCKYVYYSVLAICIAFTWRCDYFFPKKGRFEEKNQCPGAWKMEIHHARI